MASIVSSTDPFGDSSLVSKYECDNSAVDTVTAGSATVSSVTYSSTGTPFGTHHAVLPNGSWDTTITPSGRSFSISGQFYFYGTSNEILIDAYESDGANSNGITLSYQYNFGVPYLRLQVIYGGTSPAYYTEIEYDLDSADTFYHIVVTQNTSGTKVYLDTVEIISTTAKCLNLPFNDTVICKSPAMDQLEIYNRALTTTEVEMLSIQGVIQSGEVDASSTATMDTSPTATMSGELDATTDASLSLEAGRIVVCVAQITGEGFILETVRVDGEVSITNTASLDIDSSRVRTSSTDIESINQLIPVLQYVCYIPGIEFDIDTYTIELCGGSMRISRFRNDTYPIYATIKVNDEAINLTNKTVKMSIKTDTTTHTITGTNILATEGLVEFVILPAYVDEFGDFTYDVEVTDTVTGMIATHGKDVFELVEDITV